jgi:hypothetical protein
MRLSMANSAMFERASKSRKRAVSSAQGAT